MQNLMKNPIFRLVGIILILYFALLNNKKSPDSLGNRLSQENIIKNLSQGAKQTRETYKKAKEYQNKGYYFKIGQQIDHFKIHDSLIGLGKTAKLNDKIIINYSIYSTRTNKRLENNKNFELILGKNKFDSDLEKYIFGMKEGGMRSIVPTIDSQTRKNFSQLLKNNQDNLKFEIFLIKVN